MLDLDRGRRRSRCCCRSLLRLGLLLLRLLLGVLLRQSLLRLLLQLLYLLRLRLLRLRKRSLLLLLNLLRRRREMHFLLRRLRRRFHDRYRNEWLWRRLHYRGFLTRHRCRRRRSWRLLASCGGLCLRRRFGDWRRRAYHGRQRRLVRLVRLVRLRCLLVVVCLCRGGGESRGRSRGSLCVLVVRVTLVRWLLRWCGGGHCGRRSRCRGYCGCGSCPKLVLLKASGLGG